MPYKRPIGYRTPKEIVESTPFIRRTEASFTKKKGPFQELKEISVRRTKDSTLPDFNKIENSASHSHITKSVKSYVPPSIQDITGAVGNSILHNIHTYEIFIIDKKSGKNIGRTFFSLTKKTNKIIKDEYNKNKDFVSDKYIQKAYFKNNPKRLEDLKNDKGLYATVKKKLLFQRLLEDRVFSENKFHLPSLGYRRVLVPVSEYVQILQKEFGLQLRFVAMPGYKFNPEKVIFDKIK